MSDGGKSQLTSAQNQFSTVTRAYDAAGHLTWENQNLGALVNKKVQYEYDAGGKTTRLYVNDTDYHDLDFRYDAMGRFEKILNHNDGALWFQYSYDAASNETQRFNTFNSVAEIYTRDPLNRISRRSESIVYDTVGRVQTYTNRGGAVQTFTYDGRNRQTSSTWSDGTTAPSMTYDPASRVTQISNADAVIKNIFFDDNTLKSQEEWATAASTYHRTVSYTYDLDGNRATIAYPSGKNYDYGYSGRNQFWFVRDMGTGLYQAAYVYDLNGNMTTRYVGSNWIVTDASQRDPMNQITHLEHRFTGTTRTFDYTYNAMGSRTSIKRDGGTPESYGYDLAQQVTAGVENGVAATYAYDANGNRTALNDGGTYATNNLNQQTMFHGQTVGHDTKGNVNSYGSTAIYVHDAQNRLRNVTTGGVTTVFKYDGLNRKISQTIGGVTTYNVWDGWNLIEERSASNAVLHSYLYGAGEIIERITGATKRFYFQDGLGSTSHFAEEAGTLRETYKYGTFGQHTIYDAAGAVQTNPNLYDVRHLFTGQLWMPRAGLYDYRNRAYSPTLTRFLQPDPIGFAGDPSNLYRYCGNNPVNATDPTGLNVRLWGFGANVGFRAVTSFSAQVGFSYGWRNPMTWTIGYNISYVPGTSVTTFTGGELAL